MALELRQQVKLTQQLILTPQLQQAIKLLQLNRLELEQVIRQEIEQNPVLEQVELETKTISLEDISSEVKVDGEVTLASESPLGAEAVKEFDWEAYFQDTGSSYPSFAFEEKEAQDYERRLSKPENLVSHLLWQLYLSDFTEKEREIGEYIIGNLDERGYLSLEISEIAGDLGVSQEAVLSVLKKIQFFDPVGVASRDLRECLLVQLEHLGLTGTLAEKIVRDHLKLLENNNLSQLAKILGVTVDDVEAAIEIIRNLEPRPARNYADTEPQYIEPDVEVFKEGDEWIVRLVDEDYSRLKISPYYRKLLQDPTTPLEVKQYIQKKLKAATWFIKSIEQRNRTLLKVSESIMRFQRDFLEKGVVGLKPLTLKEVALDVDLHESTVSRVTTGKYIDTPHGLFELKYFFSSGYKSASGEEVASETVKQYIREIIAQEDPKRPYSDQKISDILRQKYDIKIARRTVAKYRDQMGILPASRRKNKIK
ncbi:RNA polymerase, sigma 54 subunit, RpoN [Thermodesulfatator indicus DSM 15286]|uniref:RNA polymerase, sigma 54 subunit, RpoN n=1 Tax=Thermodesulfatator indicus (strain DSM 15286 / JCM 11887 / CIR29812) TaxID=667014 RepID=F8A9N7_THEID|nr:RNA polymerase factor sigma-54 [Thermodesulfatator indicus]AEH45268.1 RNA polymerase, sigma 54 subunit, RpoN [Thermodesulfatator indicus DSM 15286]